MYWVCGDMWRGIEYMEELGNAQLWQLSIAGSWRDNASPLRKSSVCSASCAAVRWVGRNLRTALDMSHASPTWELQKTQARAAGCRSRQLGRCTFPCVCYLSIVDDFLLPLPLLYLDYREPFKVDRWLQVVWTLACSHCHCWAGGGCLHSSDVPCHSEHHVGVSVDSERMNSNGLYGNKVHYLLE